MMKSTIASYCIIPVPSISPSCRSHCCPSLQVAVACTHECMLLRLVLHLVVLVCTASEAWRWLLSRDENGRERSGKPLNHSRNCIFWSETDARTRKSDARTRKSDGKTKSVLRDIGNGINRSGACRLRSGIDNSKRENTYNNFKHLTR